MPQHISWQKSSYCGAGDSCVHISLTWQKSSYCSEGASCVRISTGPAATIHLTESADPTRTTLNTTPSSFRALLHVLKLDLLDLNLDLDLDKEPTRV